MSSDIAISVKNIGKCYEMYAKPHHRLLQTLTMGRKNFYKEFWALQDISFEVKRGECFGIIGRNGSGKSTLLQIIAQTLSPSTGSIEVNGRISALLELGSGFNPEFTGRENIYMNGAVLGLSQKEIDEKFDDIVAFADIGEFIEQPVKIYSSGMSARLAFATAINVEPDILIVDEALSVGDEFFQRKCFARIEEIKKNGATILFVSHAAGTIVELCDHAILIDAGHKLAVGAPKHIVGIYQKLLYAPIEKQEEIKQSVQNLMVDGYLPDNDVEKANLTCKKSDVDDGQAEFYNPHLQPTTTLLYESLGANISIPEILTLAGEKVNNLRSGETYNYVYNVSFHKDSFDVRFGMMIKTLSGIEIGGIGSNTCSNGIDFLKAGTNIKVSFTFQCHLLEGHYFANAGCCGLINGADTFLHRIIDAVSFCVLPINNLEMRGGYVDFACKPSYCIMEHDE